MKKMKGFKQMTETEFLRLKQALKEGASIKSIVLLTGRSTPTICLIRRMANFEEYRQFTRKASKKSQVVEKVSIPTKPSQFNESDPFKVINDQLDILITSCKKISVTCDELQALLEKEQDRVSQEKPKKSKILNLFNLG